MYLPGLLPGETLYSWCARFHRLRGIRNPRITSQDLFGQQTAGLRSDIPRCLDHFHRVTRGLLGDPLKLITERTQARFYSRFQNNDEWAFAVSAMLGDGAPDLYRRIGISNDSLGLLKACPECLEEDCSILPSAWWHVEHQWPGTFICLRHQSPLLLSTPSLYERHFKDWYLPYDLQPRALYSLSISDPTSLRLLIRIGEWAAAIAEQPGQPLEVAPLQYAYLVQAKAKGWVSEDGGVQYALIEQAMMKAYLPLHSIPRILPAISFFKDRFLESLLKETTGHRHPVRHVYLLAFLFETPAEFFHCYSAVKKIVKTDGISGIAKVLSNGGGAHKGYSNIDAAQHNDKEDLELRTEQVSSAISKAKPRKRRNSAGMTEELVGRLDIYLRTGKSRKEISMEVGVSRNYLRGYLGRKPELREAWEKAVIEKERGNHRRYFLDIIQSHSDLSIRMLKRLLGRSYSWLETHDNLWLQQNLPGLWRDR